MRRTIALLGLILLTACTKRNFDRTSAPESLNNVDQGLIEKSDRPACEVGWKDYSLDARIVALEITSSGGLSFGFDLLSGFLASFKASFAAKSGFARMMLKVFPPFEAAVPASVQTGSAKMSGREFRFEFKLQQYGGGIDLVRRTPLFELTSRMIDDAFSKAKTDPVLRFSAEGWNARVASLPEDGLAILNAGSKAGLRRGDRIEFHNVIHEWEGGPSQACRGKYLLMRASPRTAVAVGEIEDIQEFASSVRLISRDASHPLEMGSLGTLVGAEDGRGLKKTVEIRGVSSEALTGLNGERIDVTPWLRAQFEERLSRHGLMERP